MTLSIKEDDLDFCERWCHKLCWAFLNVVWTFAGKAAKCSYLCPRGRKFKRRVCCDALVLVEPVMFLPTEIRATKVSSGDEMMLV